MTRLEYVMKKIIKKTKEEFCPGRYDSNFPVSYFDTEIYDERNNISGCRGITCEQCWNVEYKEGQDDQA